MVNRKKQKDVSILEDTKHICWGYCRVSTMEQYDTGFSLGHQKTAIEDYCNKHNLNLVKIYLEEGSGKDFDHRPKATEMMSRLAKNDVIVTTRLDRFTRNTEDLLNKLREIKEKGATIVFLDFQNIDLSSPMGEATLQLASTMSQLERKSISQRTSAVMQDMSKKGMLRCRPRYGWKKIEGVKDFVIDEEEQKVISRIRDIIEENPKIKYGEIAEILTTEGIKIRKCKVNYPTSIRRIVMDNQLRNDDIEPTV